MASTLHLLSDEALRQIAQEMAQDLFDHKPVDRWYMKRVARELNRRRAVRNYTAARLGKL